MLVLTRKRNEAIMIGNGVEIKILRIGRDGVRLGIEASRSVVVHRREVYDAVCDHNRTAITPTHLPGAVAEGLRRLAAQRGTPIAAGGGLRLFRPELAAA